MKATMIIKIIKPCLDDAGSINMGCIYLLILNRALFTLP